MAAIHMIFSENPNPIWTVPIHIILSLIFASILTIYVEEPARKWMKNVRDRRINQQNIVPSNE